MDQITCFLLFGRECYISGSSFVMRTHQIHYEQLVLTSILVRQIVESVSFDLKNGSYADRDFHLVVFSLLISRNLECLD
jgi:hypothetical protein